MEEKEYCCGMCKHLEVETDLFDDTHYWCPKTGCDDISCDGIPCEWFEEEK